LKVTLPDIAPLLNASSRAEIRNHGSEVRRPAGSTGVSPALSAQREEFWSATPRRRFAPGSIQVQDGFSGSKRQLLTAHRSLPTGGWRRIAYDVQGEWGLYLILDQFLKSPAESRRAAAGWGGDRFEVYEGPKGEVLIASLSTWDTENDAREFFDAYVKRTALRYPNAKNLGLPAPDDRSRDSKPETQNSASTFHTSEGLVTVELRGTRVLVIEGCPEWVDKGTVAKTLW
jgi:hypothetical protein